MKEDSYISSSFRVGSLRKCGPSYGIVDKDLGAYSSLSLPWATSWSQCRQDPGHLALVHESTTAGWNLLTVISSIFTFAMCWLHLFRICHCIAEALIVLDIQLFPDVRHQTSLVAINLLLNTDVRCVNENLLKAYIEGHDIRQLSRAIFPLLMLSDLGVKNWSRALQ